jgi:hypothetical protein
MNRNHQKPTVTTFYCFTLSLCLLRLLHGMFVTPFCCTYLKIARIVNGIFVTPFCCTYLKIARIVNGSGRRTYVWCKSHRSVGHIL